MLAYERDPEAIYERSFATIRDLPQLQRLDPEIAPMIIRIVHACGMADVVDEFQYSSGLIRAGSFALRQGAPIFCDTESLRQSVIARLLPTGVEIHCDIGETGTRAHARANAMTRAAAQIDLWGERLTGSIVAIGNAPTALFRLLERLDEGLRPPALVLAFPVGFVGAAESKAELYRNPRGMEYATLAGMRGGTAMAAAALNALAGGLGR